jgi:hypothetical protein
MVTSVCQWQWDTTAPVPVVTGYPQANGFSSTKTGLQPDDLQQMAGVPLQYYGKPPIPVSDAQMVQWIRYAEDWIEQQTGVLLTQCWIASPPCVTPQQAQAIGVTTTFSGGYQRQGFDYDIPDAAYDFIFPRAQDEGWMIYNLHYKPVTQVEYGPLTPNAIQQISYIYPLLNEFFRVPPEWQVEDHDFGLVRLVPATNVQMLPLFAMQLAFMGFAQSVPGGIWMQYKAGLRPYDLQNRYNFLLRTVLAAASMTALSAIQGGINLGMQSTQIMVDGLQYKTAYDVKGPYNGLIENFMRMRDEGIATARNFVAGPVLVTL